MPKTALSLYAGAGGLDLGVRAAGFNILTSVEQDEDCCQTLLANGTRDVFQGTVEEFARSQRFRELCAVDGGIDMLFGGPPCQPFSKTAHWTRGGPAGLADPRAKTLSTFLEIVEQLRPKALLLENVEGFARNGGMTFITEGLEAINRRVGTSYAPYGQLLNAAHFGVPQNRRRYFMLALRSGSNVSFPEETHGAGRAAFATPWAAFHGIGSFDEDLSPRGRWAGLLASIPEGQNYLWHTARGGGIPLFGWRTRYWSFLFKLARDKPSPTIVASPSQNTGPYHWENRLLSTAELARLQTFPADYRFWGDRTSRQRQIGNAVPPLLAEQIARASIVALGGRCPRKLRFAMPACKETPMASAPASVPQQYLHLAGDHAPHPGTGKGPKGKAQSVNQLLAAE